LAISWKKVLLSGAVVDADINASAGILTSKLSGAVTDIASHGLGNVVDLNVGIGANNVLQSGGVVDGQILIVSGSSVVSVAEKTAFNRDFAGSGVAVTVSRSDHTHSAPLIAFNDLTDTSAPSPANGDILRYVTGANNWVNSTLASAGIASASHTHDYSANFAAIGGSLTQDFAVNNLTIAGEMTQSTVSSLAVDDKTIILANAGASASPTLGNGAGVEIDTSTTQSERPSLIWDMVLGWQMKKGFDINGGVTTQLPSVTRHATAVPASVSGVQAGDIYNRDSTGEIYMAVFTTP